MAKRIPKQVEAALVEAYRTQPEGGHTLARRHGVGSTTLYRVLRRNGVTIDPTKIHVFHEHRHFKLRPAQYQQMVEMYQRGVPCPDIEAKFSCSRWMILAAVRRAGSVVQRRGRQLRPWADADKAEMARLHAAGHSQEAIANRFKTHSSTVGRLLATAGLARRVRENHGNWKGGRVQMSIGYIAVLVDHDDPCASMRMSTGYVLEHRLVMARHLGRPLMANETVHHINGDPTDNRLENLQLRSGKHGKHVVRQCADCGSRNVVEVSINP